MNDLQLMITLFVLLVAGVGAYCLVVVLNLAIELACQSDEHEEDA